MPSGGQERRAMKPPWFALLVTVAVLACAAVLGACGSSDSDSDTGSTSVATSTGATSTAAQPQSSAVGGSTADNVAVNGGCGTVPNKAPKDPDGVLAALPKDVQAGYTGIGTVSKSAWADFKSSHPKPWKIGWVFSAVDTPFGGALDKQIRAAADKAKSEGLVSELVAKTSTSSQGSPTAEIQAIQSLLQDKVDIILITPLVQQSLLGVAKQAAKAGVPIVMPSNASISPALVGVDFNQYLVAASPTATAMKAVGGAGDVLIVEGFPGVAGSELSKVASEDAVAQCPDAKVAGSVVGRFTPAVAKGETLKFLSTHPAGVKAVFQGGAMASGIIGAFEQLGKPMPGLNLTAPLVGELQYWQQHPDAPFAGAAYSPTAIANATIDVALRMLAGNGIKVSTIETAAPTITAQNLDEYIPEGAPANSIAPSEGPAAGLAPDALNVFFTKPGGAS